jgi:hypothetical protein
MGTVDGGLCAVQMADASSVNAAGIRWFGSRTTASLDHSRVDGCGFRFPDVIFMIVVDVVVKVLFGLLARLSRWVSAGFHGPGVGAVVGAGLC